MIRDIVLLICILGCIALAYFGYQELSKDNSSKYKQTQATVVNVLIKDNFVQTSSSVGNTKIINNTTQYEVWPQYQYTVDNKMYSGQYKLATYNSMSIAQNEYNRIMRTASIDKLSIYYEIANPGNSAFNFPKNNAFGFFAGAVVVLIVGLVAKYGQFNFAQPQRIENVVVFNRQLFK
jgi:hypothetical protein